MKKPLDIETLNAVRIEVNASFEKEKLNTFKSFKDFFNEVDILNAYKPEWKPTKYRPYFKKIWEELQQ